MAAPLTAEDKRAIEQHLKDLKTAKEMIGRAKQAGLDMSAEEAELARIESQLTGIKRSFFPTGSAD